MSRKPAKPKARRVENTLTALELENLVTGSNLLDGDEAFANEEDRRQCWEKNRDYIMGLQGQYGKDEAFGLPSHELYFDFGQRPAAWYSYEAPEPRRVTMKRHESKGSLDYSYPSYEPQRAYLERLNLLFEAEKGAKHEEK